MKRIFALLLVCAMCVGFCACGEATPQATDPNTVIEGGAQTDATTTTTEADPFAGAAAIAVGDSISLDYVTMTLEAFEISSGYNFEYKDGFVTYQSSIDCTSGMKLVCLKGKFTNKSPAEVYPSNNPAYGKFIINGYEYKAEMDCYIVAEAESVMGVVPMQEVDYFLYAEIPENVASAIETCELYIGFVKNMDSSESSKLSQWDEYELLDALYLLNAVPTVEG